MKKLFTFLLAAAMSAAAGLTSSAQMSFQIGATIPLPMRHCYIRTGYRF